MDNENHSSSMNWYTFSFSLPTKPSRVRVSVWRKLKKAGAISFGGGQWILPKRDECLAVLTEIQNEIEQNRGEALLADSIFNNIETDKRIIRQFDDERALEYYEFLHKCDDLLKELEEESKIEKFTFAELEENDEMHTRLSDWLKKIQERDFFNSEYGNKANNKWTDCEKALDAFADEVYNRSLTMDGQEYEK